MVGWLDGCLGRSVGCLVGWLDVWSSIGWSVGRISGRSVGQPPIQCVSSRVSWRLIESACAILRQVSSESVRHSVSVSVRYAVPEVATVSDVEPASEPVGDEHSLCSELAVLPQLALL